jgi:hypothetical protein
LEVDPLGYVIIIVTEFAGGIVTGLAGADVYAPVYVNVTER